MQITLDINKEKRHAAITCDDNIIYEEEMDVAIGSFLIVIADNIKNRNGNFEDSKKCIQAIVDKYYEVIEKGVFNNINETN